MIVCATITEVRAALSRLRAERSQQLGRPATVGFVPTMGYLHLGHASLLDQSYAMCDITVLSIFLNPLQFAVGEDLSVYPRDAERDLMLAKSHQTDVVFMPDVHEMYPANSTPLTTVHVKQVTEVLCGVTRPGHFAGVATVVSKLFHIIQPDHAFFGLKDAQQVAVIEQMVVDLNFPVNIIPCPTVRETDGLALSSRNVYLNEAERTAATVLYRTLAAIEMLLESAPELTFERLKIELARRMAAEPLAQVEYVECLRFPSLQVLDTQHCADVLSPDGRTERVLVAVAVRFGRTRLIDNRLLGGAQGA